MKGTMPFTIYVLVVLLSHFVLISDGFSIKLVHPYSKESPLYKPDISYSQMIELLSLQPRIRAKSSRSLIYNDTLNNMKVIQPTLKSGFGGGYLAKLNLGNFPGQEPSHMSYFLHFDTGSYMTWLQCEDCTMPKGHCFEQNGIPYPNTRSTTYSPLPCGRHNLCFPDQCLKEHCSYNVGNDDSANSFGILAYETLTFGHAETTKVVIGFGIRNQMNLLNEDYENEAGVLGLGWGPHSFVNQIPTYSQGRFSYCLPPIVFDEYEEHSAILRFGNDIPTYPGMRSLSIHQYSQEENYYVNLQGISINSKRLGIPPRYFDKIAYRNGGCIIDTGTTYTKIPKNAYRILKEEVVHYLTTVDKSLVVTGEKDQFDLCFERNPPFKKYNNLPKITFHFEQGVDLVQQPDIAFVVYDTLKKEYVCMGILPSQEDNIAIIGSQSQANHVFLYDQPARKVYFAPHDCAQSP